jgi:hypothetical protein
MPTLKEKREKIKHRTALAKEAQKLMLERANIRKKFLLGIALTNFAAENLDLLTQDDHKKYKSVIVG